MKLTPVTSLEELQKGANVYYYESNPELNRFATPGSEQARLHVIKNPVVHVNLED